MRKNYYWVIGLWAAGLSAGAMPTALTGEPAVLRGQYIHHDDEMAYSLVDNGEGIWETGPQGISLYGRTLKTVYQTPGVKPRRWTSVTVTGTQGIWKDAPVEVAGDALPARTPLAAKLSALNVSGEPYDKLWISAVFDRHRVLEGIELIPDGTGLFPLDFEIESTIDGGKTWDVVPSSRVYNFPNPGKNRVRIPLNGLMADAVRVVSFRSQRGGEKHALALGGLEVFGGGAPLFEATGMDPVKMASWNNLWLTFGSAQNEIHDYFDPTWPTGRPYSGGMLATFSGEWALWNAQKMCWMNSDRLEEFAEKYRSYPTDANGYIWVSPDSPKHLGHSRHFTATPIYISAMSYYYLMTRNEEFLHRKHPQLGESILEKMERGMAMMLNEMGGASGLVTIRDPDLRGLPDSQSNNYWDGWTFGHLSAYMNLHFHDAVARYADLLDALGRDAEAEKYHALLPLIRKRFNEAFWNGDKGRYVGWIDANGRAVDFGFVFVNLKILRHGLATPERAGQVLAWIDGQRIIEHERSQGSDIYHYRFSPRSSTLAAEDDPESGFKLFWNESSKADKTKDSNANWLRNAQQGGTLFYISYYDLHARKKYLGQTNALQRMDAILEESLVHQMRRMPISPFGAGTAVGVVREFPESGLVPFYFVDGIMGMNPVADGLELAPDFPAQWGLATLRDVYFNGMRLDIVASHGIGKARKTVGEDGRLTLHLPVGETVLLTPDGALERR